jgi:Icc-related predicted phosphoesterase
LSRIHNVNFWGAYKRFWLSDKLNALKNQVNVVVTHHGPAMQSLPERYVNNIITSAYVSNFEGIIKSYRPRYWLHGHLHNNSDYQIGNCRVICNPKDYPQKLNPNFNPTFTFEI